MSKKQEETLKQKLKHTLYHFENILGLNNDSYDKARFLLDRKTVNKTVNGPLIQFLGNNIYGGSNGTLNIESKNQKRENLPKLMSQILQESDATETVEDMCNIIDNEQVKEHNLEKSWEFEQSISDWLKRIHQDLTTTTDTTDFKSLSQVAEVM
ncbi:unnamed protein product [Rhizophagus irregularis]|nr:unnamed protein product [Rhizophagus irregularis]